MDQERRVGMNEAIFRQVNEEIRSVGDELGVDEGMITVICECGDSQCTDRIRLPLAEYERVRGDSLLYVIANGHEFPEIESVVERARRPRRGAQAGAGSGRDRTGDRPA